MSKGVIYILTNPSFPDYVKIGFASDVEKRVQQLNHSSSVPFAFRVYAVYETENALTDKELHKLIDTLNPDLRAIETFAGKKRTKEFYAMSKEDAFLLLECIAKISGTEANLKKVAPTGEQLQEDQIAEEIKENARRGPFRFSKCKIPVNSTIYFIQDKTKSATVVDDRHVKYNGETVSLTALAKTLLGVTTSVQGPLYFMYNDERLSDIRNKLEGKSKH